MKKIILILLLIGSIGSKGFSQLADQKELHKVVIQLNSADTSVWSSTIGNIKNIQKALQGQVQIDIVVHGKALDLLVKDHTHLAKEVLSMENEMTHFKACENTMRKHGITKEMLLDKIGTVPSGVVEVILKQESGWSYLRAAN